VEPSDELDLMLKLRDIVGRPLNQGPDLPSWLEHIMSRGIVARDPQIVRRQRCVNVAAYSFAANAMSHFVINSLHDFRGLLPVNIYNVIMFVVFLSIPRLHRFGEFTAAMAFCTIALFGHMFVVWSFGLASDIHIYYTMSGAILFFFGIQHWRRFLVFFLPFIFALLIASNFAPNEGWFIPNDDAFRELLSSQAMINTIIINAAILFYALTLLHRAEIQLHDQYERSEALIGAVMPMPIAERLKAGEDRIADSIPMLTVMFADLVNFTSAAHDLAPGEVVAFLDGLVRNFDRLSELHDVEKIKTIGDCYMAASGFSGNAADGAVAVGRLALSFCEAISRQDALGDRRLGLRIGIHSGPATAGVIGDTRFSYDIWGDGVNTASRMESNGKPGHIQVSESFRNLAADAFIFEERGVSEFKGIGATRTFFLIGEAKGN
jgi:adenylate cyclase